MLDKNEKKLSKKNSSIVLTEKEIQLIELLLNNSKPISKDKILSTVELFRCTPILLKHIFID